MRRATFALIAGVSVTSACTDLLGINDDYVVYDAASGGACGEGFGGLAPTAASGGGHSGGAGGRLSASDASVPTEPSAGGATLDARVDAEPSGPEPCPPSMKRCNGSCVTPDPSVGCGLEGCAICPYPPENAIAICAGSACAFQCADGFELHGTDMACEAMPSAGGAGPVDSGPAPPPTGGSAGAPTCDPALCPRCPFIPNCCNVFGRCGCNYVAACI